MGFGLIIFLCSSCVKDKLDFERFSDRAELNPSIAAPILKGQLSFENIYNSDDSTLTINGDSIIYIYQKDSIVNFNVKDFANVPEQDTLSYYMRSDVDIPGVFMPNEFSLRKTEEFTFTFDNGMRPDSIAMNTGLIYIGIQSTFKHTGALRINSPSIINDAGEEFSEVMLISSYTGDFQNEKYFPIDNSTLVFLHPHPDTSEVHLHFDLLLRKTPGEGISASEFVKIDFSFVELEDYESIFGYAGQLEKGIDTIIDMDFGNLENLKGTFAVTNPKLNFRYLNSMGVPFSLDLKLNGVFEDNNQVNISPECIEVLCPDKHQDEAVNSKVSFNRNNIYNIDSILVFPPPVSFDLDVGAISNPEGETHNPNFIHYDSKLDVDMEIEIPLEFRADLQLVDTMVINMNNMSHVSEIEYINLYHTIRNEFPLNIGFDLVLYDSISQQKIDTIAIKNFDEPLLVAAPVDAFGVTMKDQVQTRSGFVTLTDTQADNLISEANKIIVIGNISSTNGARTVKILNNYLFDFKLGIEAKAKIEVN